MSRQDQVRADHQPVEAVAFRVAAQHGMEGVFQGATDVVQLDLPSVGPLHREIQHGGVLAPAAIGVERHLEGIFGDHFQAQILEHRQRGRQRQHFAQHIQFQPQHRGGVFGLAPGLGAQLEPILGAGQFFQDHQIARRVMRREALAIAGREFGRQRRQPGEAFVLAVGGAQRLGKSVVPGFDQGGDLFFQGAHIHPRHRAVIAADDVMQPHQRARVQHHLRGRGAAVEGLGQQGMNLLADMGGNMVARRQQQRRDKAVETVEAQEQLEARQARPNAGCRWRSRTVRRPKPGTVRRAERCRGYGPAPCRRGWRRPVPHAPSPVRSCGAAAEWCAAGRCRRLR